MLLPRPQKRPNERRILTLRLDEKPGDPQTPVGLWSQLDERRGSRHSSRGRRQRGQHRRCPPVRLRCSPRAVTAYAWCRPYDRAASDAVLEALDPWRRVRVAVERRRRWSDEERWQISRGGNFAGRQGAACRPAVPYLDGADLHLAPQAARRAARGGTGPPRKGSRRPCSSRTPSRIRFTRCGTPAIVIDLERGKRVSIVASAVPALATAALEGAAVSCSYVDPEQRARRDQPLVSARARALLSG